MEKQEQLLPNPRRSILQMAVAGILDELGFVKADKECVESLTEVNFVNTFHTQVLCLKIISFVFLRFRCFKAVSNFDKKKVKFVREKKT